MLGGGWPARGLLAATPPVAAAWAAAGTNAAGVRHGARGRLSQGKGLGGV
jgi:hypothetical protein